MSADLLFFFYSRLQFSNLSRRMDIAWLKHAADVLFRMWIVQLPW